MKGRLSPRGDSSQGCCHVSPEEARVDTHFSMREIAPPVMVWTRRETEGRRRVNDLQDYVSWSFGGLQPGSHLLTSQPVSTTKNSLLTHSPFQKDLRHSLRVKTLPQLRDLRDNHW